MGKVKAALMEAEAQLASDYPRWKISWDYGYYTAYHDNYEAEWLGEEVGWQDNGLTVSARTIDGLRAEIEAMVEEREDAR